MGYMTQEIFDRSVKGILDQGKLSADNGSCRYRSLEGLRCAVGQLINEDCYDSKIEGLSASSETLKPLLRSSGIDYDDVWLLIVLQRLHDTVEIEHGHLAMDEFKRRAKNLAEILGLKWNIEVNDE
jgi:hypothetical protein